MASPEIVMCPHCGKQFARTRRNKKFCQPKCQKGSHQKNDRLTNPVNAASSPTKKRSQLEFFETAGRLAEMLYSLPVDERLGFMKELIDHARDGNQTLRSILTNKYLLCAGNKDMMQKLSQPHLVFHGHLTLRHSNTGKLLPTIGDFDTTHFWKNCPSYPTITQAAELYCQRFWSSSTKQVINGSTPEPDTGESLEPNDPLNNRKAA